eukprot:1182476-Prorocentrum_minimum.AAC.5
MPHLDPPACTEAVDAEGGEREGQPRQAAAGPGTHPNRWSTRSVEIRRAKLKTESRNVSLLALKAPQRSCLPKGLGNRPTQYIRRGKRRRVLVMDQSDAESAGIFSRWTNQTQEACAYSHDGQIRRGQRGRVLAMDRSDARSTGIFSQWTNQMQEARVHSHDGPIRSRGTTSCADASRRCKRQSKRRWGRVLSRSPANPKPRTTEALTGSPSSTLKRTLILGLLAPGPAGQRAHGDGSGGIPADVEVGQRGVPVR